VYSVLIADDDPTHRFLVREVLDIDPSLLFLEATDGAHALTLARLRCPALILLDVVLPRGDGLSVCHLLKANPSLAKTRIIFLTAATDEALGWQAGCDAYLVKPYENTVLLGTVQRLLGSQTTCSA
jgi:two-component system, OmpR family, alkaline phosphatase synthesis response regulator PhoP